MQKKETKNKKALGIYQLWEVKNEKEALLGSFKTLKQLEKSWEKYHNTLILQARVYTGESYVVVNDEMPKVSEYRFQTPAKWKETVLKNAVVYSVIRFLGVGKYERYYKETEAEAIQLAMELSGKTKRKYLVYGVAENGASVLIGVAKSIKVFEHAGN